MNSKRVIAAGYDRMGEDFATWNDSLPADGRRWFLGEILARVPEGSTVLELGCGPGTDAAALSLGRGYVGIDLSPVQLSIARRRAPRARFAVADLTVIPFRAESFDAIVAFYAFNHVAIDEVVPAFASAFACLRRGGQLMLAGIPTFEDVDRVEEWLDVPMFFAGIEPGLHDRALGQVGFQVEMSEIRFATQEWWGVSEPRWIIATKPA